MGRTSAIGAAALLVASATLSGAGDDAPPLLPPSGTAAPSPSRPISPPDPTPIPSPASTPPSVPTPAPRLLYGLRPRVTVPNRVIGQAGPRVDPTDSSTRDNGLPALTPPGDLSPMSPTRRAPRPLMLESVPLGSPDASADIRPRPDARAREDAPKERTEELPARNPSRLSRLFGRAPAAPLPAPRSRNNSGSEDSITLEPRSDPAADAALKRRLEKQAEEAVGGRARSIEVRVVDRNIRIRAKVDRFWNRRAVRRSLETLPGVSGYKTTVDVVD
jgi:hypothetical protein